MAEHRAPAIIFAGDAPYLDVEVPATFREALRYMRRPNFVETPRYRAQQWKASREGAKPELVAFTDAFVAACARLGIPVYPRTMYRTRDAQLALYVTGKSSEKENAFTEGTGVEIVHSLKDELPEICWQLLGHVGLEVARNLGLRIDWKGPDFPARWELDK